MSGKALIRRLFSSKNGIFDDITITSALHNDMLVLGVNFVIFHANRVGGSLVPKTILKMYVNLLKLCSKTADSFPGHGEVVLVIQMLWI